MLLESLSFLLIFGDAMIIGSTLLPTREMLGFSSEAFEQILHGKTEEKLRAALDACDIPQRNEARARQRLAELVATREAEEKALEDARREREIVAAERAALAAERSVRWAAVAVGISLTALLIAALPLTPFFK